MKNSKRILFTCLAVMSIFFLSACDSNNKNTIKEQLLDEMINSNKNVEEITHLEIVDDGTLVFYTWDDNLHVDKIK